MSPEASGIGGVMAARAQRRETVIISLEEQLRARQEQHAAERRRHDEEAATRRKDREDAEAQQQRLAAARLTAIGDRLQAIDDEMARQAGRVEQLLQQGRDADAEQRSNSERHSTELAHLLEFFKHLRQQDRMTDAANRQIQGAFGLMLIALVGYLVKGGDDLLKLCFGLVELAALGIGGHGFAKLSRVDGQQKLPPRTKSSTQDP